MLAAPMNTYCYPPHARLQSEVQHNNLHENKQTRNSKSPSHGMYRCTLYSQIGGKQRQPEINKMYRYVLLRRPFSSIHPLTVSKSICYEHHFLFTFGRKKKAFRHKAWVGARARRWRTAIALSPCALVECTCDILGKQKIHFRLDYYRFISLSLCRETRISRI